MDYILKNIEDVCKKRVKLSKLTMNMAYSNIMNQYFVKKGHYLIWKWMLS